MNPLTQHNDAIWSALSNHAEYLTSRAIDDNISDQTKLAYLRDLKACRDAMAVVIKYWDKEE